MKPCTDGSIPVGDEQEAAPMGHTPGPWRISKVDVHTIVGVNHEGIANVLRLQAKSAKETEANARLIAAAPALLAACQVAFDNLKPAYSSEHIVMKKLTAAIAQATGA